jgi:hypothetical protein
MLSRARRNYRRFISVTLVGILAVALSGSDGRSASAANVLDAGRLHQQLRAYANSNVNQNDWSGGDGAASVKLPDGRMLWLMNDSFLGPVNADGSRPANIVTVHNAGVLQDASTYAFGPTLLTPTPGQPKFDFVQSPSPDTYYWLLDAVVEGNNLRVLTVEQPGDRTFVVTLSLPALTQVGERVEIPSFGKGAWARTFETSNYTYVYNTATYDDNGTPYSETYTARVPRGQLSVRSAWRYWNGTRWQAEVPGQHIGLAPLGGRLFDGMIVAQVGGKFILAGFNRPLSGEVVIARGDSPIGPFEPQVVAFDDPAIGQPCYSGELVSYSLQPHRELWKGDMTTAEFSYSVNCFGDLSALLKNVELYRPRFMELDLTA